MDNHFDTIGIEPIVLAFCPKLMKIDDLLKAPLLTEEKPGQWRCFFRFNAFEAPAIVGVALYVPSSLKGNVILHLLLPKLQI